MKITSHRGAPPGRVLNDNALEALANYKYAGGDNSILYNNVTTHYLARAKRSHLWHFTVLTKSPLFVVRAPPFCPELHRQPLLPNVARAQFGHAHRVYHLRDHARHIHDVLRPRALPG